MLTIGGTVNNKIISSLYGKREKISCIINSLHVNGGFGILHLLIRHLSSKT